MMLVLFCQVLEEEEAGRCAGYLLVFMFCAFSFNYSSSSCQRKAAILLVFYGPSKRFWAQHTTPYLGKPSRQFTSTYCTIFTFSLQSPSMKLALLLQFISQWKTFTSHVIYTTPCGGSTNSVFCLLMFAWRWSGIAMTLSVGVLSFGCSKTSVRYGLILNIQKISRVWC